MNQRGKYLFRPFVSHRQSAEVLQLGIASLDDPPALVSPHLSSVLMSGDLVIASGRDDQLDPSFDKHRSHGVAVIPAIADEPLRLASFADPILTRTSRQRGGDQLYFRRGSLYQVYSQRSTCAIGQYHKLCSLAAFSLLDQRAPFFARMNMPSMMHSSQRTFCRSESWFKKARHRLSSVPLSAHCWSRRLTALFEPYRSGSSLQGAPVHKIQSMPSKHKRPSIGGRPPLRLRRCFGECGLSLA